MESYKRNIKRSQRIEYGIYQFLDHFLGRGRVNKVLGNRRKAFYNYLLETLKKGGEGKTIEIERRKDLSLNEFRKYYLKKGIPVIMEGAANDWGCVKKWTFEYIKELHGSDEALVFEQNSTQKYKVKLLSDILNTITSGGKEYLRLYPLLNLHPEHLADFDRTWLNEHREKSATWYPAFSVFIGSKDTETKLHMEDKCNMFIQIYGEKKWVLFHPYFSSIFDPPPIKGLFRSAKIVVEHNDVDFFNREMGDTETLFRYIDRFEGIIKPGDILWMPSFYWHTVQNLTNSIGANYRWLNPTAAFKMAPLYMLLDLFQMNPTVWKALDMSTDDPNKIILAKDGNLQKYLQERKEKSVA